MAIDLAKKVGPLPVWGYGALAAAGAGYLFWFRKNKGAAASGTTDPIDPNTGVPYSQEWSGTPSILGGPGSTVYGDGGSNPPATAGPPNGGGGPTNSSPTIDSTLKTITSQYDALHKIVYASVYKPMTASQFAVANHISLASLQRLNPEFGGAALSGSTLLHSGARLRIGGDFAAYPLLTGAKK